MQVECLTCGVEMHPADAANLVKKELATYDGNNIICQDPNCKKVKEELVNQGVKL